jgi:hypothetical protein
MPNFSMQSSPKHLRIRCGKSVTGMSTSLWTEHQVYPQLSVVTYPTAYKPPTIPSSMLSLYQSKSTAKIVDFNLLHRDLPTLSTPLIITTTIYN